MGIEIVNFEKAKGEKTKTTMVSVPNDLVQTIRKRYPEINLSATVRSALQGLLEEKPAKK